MLKHHEVQFAVANSLQDSFKPIVKVAVVGPYQTEFTIYMLHAKDLAGFHASARSELRRVIKTLDKLIKETKSDILGVTEDPRFDGLTPLCAPIHVSA